MEEIFKEKDASNFKKRKEETPAAFSLVLDDIRKFDNPRGSPGWAWDQCLKGRGGLCSGLTQVVFLYVIPLCSSP